MQTKLFIFPQKESKSRNKSKKSNFVITKNHQIDGDFYATPGIIIRQLLLKIKIIGKIWEPCCGDGAISEILKEFNYSVFSSDLFDRGYGTSGIDFLTSKKKSTLSLQTRHL